MEAVRKAQDVQIGPLGLPGILDIPPMAKAVILFAHGSGSSRLSPRNAHVATALRKMGLATVLFDLLTDQAAADRANVFDIDLLAERLLIATDWAAGHGALRGKPLGYFGASTGAAAALVAAARSSRPIGAIVSRGGRPDMAEAVLDKVEAPTLLIVGGLDVQVLALNQFAYDRLRCEKSLEVVTGAGHLFEEPGTLDHVIDFAKAWFVRHLEAEQPTTGAS
jgi:pimeloyl-ACP methyl ester carboxylesterase